MPWGLILAILLWLLVALIIWPLIKISSDN